MSLVRAVGAELVRIRRTSAIGFIAGGLVVAVFQGLGWMFLSTRDLTSWRQLMGWQSVYATTLCVPVVALAAALTVAREQRAREGGTLWRAARPATVHLARGLVLAGLLLVFHLALFLPSLAWGLGAGLTDPPVAGVVGLAVLSWALSLAGMALGLWLTRWFGWLVTLLVALVWQAAGTLQAESAWWWVQPWAWQVRPVLPLLGVHANGVPLEGDSPVWGYPWWPGLVGSLCVAVVFFVLGGVDLPKLGGRRVAGRTPAARRRPGVLPLTRTRRRPMVGLAATLRRTAIGWLAVMVVVMLPLVGMGWGEDAVRGVVGYLVLPVGSCLLAVLAWQAQGDTWRSLATRASVPDLGWRLLGICALVLAGLAAYAAVLVAVVGTGARADALTAAEAGAGVGGALAFGVVCLLTGAAGVALSFWLTTRFGAGAAVGVMLGGLVTGLLFGGFFAETPLWLLGPGAWAYSATSPERVAIASVLSVAAFVVCSLLWFSATRRRLGGG